MFIAFTPLAISSTGNQAINSSAVGEFFAFPNAVVVAFPEEGLKLLLCIVASWWMGWKFSSQWNAVLYCMAGALGYATVLNVLNVSGALISSCTALPCPLGFMFVTSGLDLISQVPLYAGTGFLMGIEFFRSQSTNTPFLKWQGFFLPVCINILNGFDFNFLGAAQVSAPTVATVNVEFALVYVISVLITCGLWAYNYYRFNWVKNTTASLQLGGDRTSAVPPS